VRDARVAPARFALVLAMLIALAGCGGVGQQQDDGGQGGGGAGPVSTFGFSLQDEVAKARVDLFKSANPGVEVKTTEGGFDEQQFLSAVASGQPPDLVYLSRDEFGTYAARGAIVPLDDCIAKEQIDLAQFRPAAVQQVTLDGKVYGIPEFYQSRILLIDTTVLDKAGVARQDVSTTDWDKLAEVNQKLTERSGGKLERIGFDPKLPEFLPLWAKANGASIISDDGRTAQLDDPKVVEALEFAVGLVKAQGGWGRHKAFKDAFDFFGADNEFAKDQLGAMPMEDWYVNVLAQNSPDAGVVAAPFTDRQGQPLNFATGQAWAIPKGAKNPEGACRFAKAMTSKDAWVAAAKARIEKVKAENQPFTGLYTGNKPADEEIFATLYKPSGNAAFDEAVQTIRGVQDRAFIIPASRAAAEFEKAWMDAASRVLGGSQDAASALQQAQKEAQAALDKAATR
jgi:multiple sugar transport system substrate-binding protein